MKKIFTIVALLAGMLSAAASPVMNFARTVQTADGLPKANLGVKVKVVIRSGAPDGPVAFGEEHQVTTSPAGVAYVAVGSQNTDVTLDQLDWAGTTYFMETSVDCGEGYGQAVSQQILSVPRAVHAATASSLTLTSPSGKRFSVTISDNGDLSAVSID
ncbi:MAG: hypothetical protein K2G30_04155 [Muribaculaceae bacterium]|nr:hypothetical protein [Muribaculaceae bacterium]